MVNRPPPPSVVPFVIFISNHVVFLNEFWGIMGNQITLTLLSPTALSSTV
jgi:hypothetical protein